VSRPQANSAAEARGECAQFRRAGLRAGGAVPGLQHQHFGFLMRAASAPTLRPLPSGVMIYGEIRAARSAATAGVPRSEVIDELYDALRTAGRRSHNGAMGHGDARSLLAIIDSAQSGMP